MPTACTFLVWLIFAAPYQTNRKWNLKLYTHKNHLSFANTNVEKYTWHFTHPVIYINKNQSITCFTGK
jgi:hypothetical protein